jgi:hypothetical protein
MTIEKIPGTFVFIMKNMNRMEADKKIVEKMTQSKVGYCISGEYVLVKKGQANRAITELKKWHLL